jgi:hypothetical protein
MKRRLVFSLAILFAGVRVGIAQADELNRRPSGDGPGCGLGAQIFHDGSKTMLHQSLAATTNAIASQTFAMTTGTWGCTNNGKFVSNEHATLFASLNFDNLSQEMAQGGGEHLASLATVMGVPVEQQPAFFAMAQEPYATLIQSGEATSVALLNALHEAMATHPALGKASLVR